MELIDIHGESTLLVAIDGVIYGGRRKAKSSRDGRRSVATLIRPNNSAPLFAGELLTGFSHKGVSKLITPSYGISVICGHWPIEITSATQSR